MRRCSVLEKRTRNGGASIFVVMFTIIILSIIVLGFTRLILSEATKTMNTDLSQSAYDSALAGVEDAKIALLKYHACLDQGFRPNINGNDCERIIYYMQQGIKDRDCSVVKNVLNREANEDTENAVIVQETQNSFDEGNNTSMLQAYTCVTIQEELSDYRTTLNNESRLRIIPIRPSDSDTQVIEKIQIQWFSDVNLAKISGSKYCPDHLYAFGDCNGGNQAPTTLIARLIQTDYEFDLSELSTAKSADQTDTTQLMFVPGKDSGIEYDPENPEKNSISGIGKYGDKGENLPITIKCNGTDWLCTAVFDVPAPFRGGERHPANTYLLVSIPYGSPDTDISVTAKAKNSENDKYEPLSFVGVQARVDSTGRANDLYRRIETRLELVDTFFPYPEFEITMLDGARQLTKSFWVTDNCWGADNGDDWDCNNNNYDMDLSLPGYK